MAPRHQHAQNPQRVRQSSTSRIRTVPQGGRALGRRRKFAHALCDPAQSTSCKGTFARACGRNAQPRASIRIEHPAFTPTVRDPWNRHTVCKKHPPSRKARSVRFVGLEVLDLTSLQNSRMAINRSMRLVATVGPENGCPYSHAVLGKSKGQKLGCGPFWLSDPTRQASRCHALGNMRWAFLAKDEECSKLTHATKYITACNKKKGGPRQLDSDITYVYAHMYITCIQLHGLTPPHI